MLTYIDDGLNMFLWDDLYFS